MLTNRLAIGLTLANFVLLAVLAVSRAEAQADVQPVVRARLIELVDSAGKVRGQLKAEAGGEVTFSLWDARGQIRTEFGANEMGSGVAFMDHETNPGVRIYAGAERNRDRDSGTSIALTSPGGKRNLLKP